jgi:hypothetical protein
VVALLLCLAAPMLMAAKSSVPIELPATVKLGRFTDTGRISEALITALTNKKWIVEADTGEAIRAHFNKREHQFVIRLDYTPHEISFHYVSSTDLGYQRNDDRDYIHPNANKWLRQLGDEVQLQVQPFAFEREPTDVIPVTPAPPEPAPLPAPTPPPEPASPAEPQAPAENPPPPPAH